MIPKQSKKLKRIVSGLLSLTMITNMSAVLPANAEEERLQSSDSLTANENEYTNDEDIVSDDAVTGREDTDKKIKGDVNGDGVVNSDDRDLLHRWLVRLVGDNELDLENADVNFDGKVDIMDLIELIRLCPNTGSSDEEEPSEHYIIDEDSEILSEINTDDNAFKVSLDITTSGGELNSLTAGESEYSSIIESDMVVGVVPEFECEEGAAVDDVVLNFAVDDSFIENTNGKYADVSDDFKGIKRFNVFKYFDDIGMLLPIETTYENNVITTHVDELGTYCLVDMEQWFEALGVEASDLNTVTNSSNVEESLVITENKSLLTSNTSLATENEKISNKNIDIVLNLFLYTNSSKSVTDQAFDLGESIFNSCDESCSVRIYVVDYNGYPVTNRETDKIYAETGTELEKIMYNANNTLHIPKRRVGNFPILENSVTYFLNNYSLRENAEKYYVVVESDRVESKDISSAKTRIGEENMRAIVVNNLGAHTSLVGDTGKFCDNNCAYSKPAYDFIIGSLKKYAYRTLVPTGWKEISLEKPITKDYKTMLNDYTQADKFDFTDKKTYADTDGDGLIDLKEIRYSFNGEDVIKWDSDGNVILPTIKECRDLKAGKTYVENALSQYGFFDWKKVNNIRILPIESDPTEKDSDFDDFIDSEDPDPMNYNIITIDEKLIDDSDCINLNNPIITKNDTDKMIGHVIANQTKVDKGNDFKNELIFTRKNELIFTRTRKKGRSDGKFSLTPLREISDYAFTITNTKETNFGEGYTTDDYNSTVRISYKDGLIKKVKQVEPVEIRTSDDGTEITYVFSLEQDKTYNISVNNPTNNHEGEYYIHVSEDNWVYAPYGGVRKYKGEFGEFSMSDQTLFLSDEAFSIILKKYYEMTLPKDSPELKELLNANKDDLLKNELSACSRNLDNVKWVLYGYDDFMERMGKKESLTDIFKGYDPTGDGLSVAGIIVSLTVTGEIATPMGIAISILGIGYSMINQYAEQMIEKYNDDIVKAMNKGNYNISLTKYERESHDLFYEKNVDEKVDKWGNYYINKYMQNKYAGTQRGIVMPFKLYELKENGETFSLIPKS